MEVAEFALTMGLTLILAGIVVMANLATTTRNPAWGMMVYASISLLNGLALLFGLLTLLSANNSDDAHNEGLAFTLLVFMVIVITLLFFQPVRSAIRGLFPQKRTPEETSLNVFPTPSQPLPSIVLFEQRSYLMDMPPTTPPPLIYPQSPTAYNAYNANKPYEAGELRGFDPNSLVHMIALIYCIYLLGNTAFSFVLAGGIEGVAESLDDAGLSILSMFGQFVPMVLIPLLGMGWLIRRSNPDLLKRMGLRPFRLESLAGGAGVGVMLFITVLILNILITIILTPETLEEQGQASESIAESITSIWLVLGIAGFAAIGEEIAFRGALQPIFGMWWTAVIFVAIHLQYFLTPLMLVIFVVAVVLGLMRRYLDLYACIAAHFVYNLILALLAFIATEAIIFF